MNRFANYLLIYSILQLFLWGVALWNLYLAFAWV